MISVWLQLQTTMWGMSFQDSRQTYQKTHKYRWFVHDGNCKQQSKVHFCVCVFQDWRLIAKRQTKIKMICAWLQLQTARRGVFSQDRRQTNKKDQNNEDDLCMTATTNNNRWCGCCFGDNRQTSKTSHKYRWSVCDCNYKQQQEVCFLRTENKQTKIKMIIAWLQLTNNSERCVFSG